MKFNIYIDEKNSTVIAARPYNGHTVRCCAKCDPRDTFNTETGRRIAEARCTLKIAERRKAKSLRMAAIAREEAEKAQKSVERAEASCIYADTQYEEAKAALEALLKEIG